MRDSPSRVSSLTAADVSPLRRPCADWKLAVKAAPRYLKAIQETARLERAVHERNEKMKAEVMDKLKGLGNMILGNFGMSLDNFKAVQDPKTGSYSISYQN